MCMTDENWVELQRLSNLTQQQAVLIEALTSRSILGFFQRRRLRKMMRGGNLDARLKEDAMRNQIFQLKRKLHGKRE